LCYRVVFPAEMGCGAYILSFSLGVYSVSTNGFGFKREDNLLP